MMVPTPRLLSRVSSPLCERAISLAKASPSPVPGMPAETALLARKNRSKMRAWSSDEMPIPVSATVKHRAAPSVLSSMVTTSPTSEYLMPFESRFPTTRSSC